MSVSNWITLIGIVVAAAVALAIAHMERKQMRQIELHRLDPKAPLKPPPHPVLSFLKRYGFQMMSVAFIAYNVYVLVWQEQQATPLTRREAVDISFHMAGIAFFSLSGAWLYFLERSAELDREEILIIKELLKITDELTDMVRAMAKKITELEGREKKPKR